jgi:hypothetical protein
MPSSWSRWFIPKWTVGTILRRPHVSGLAQMQMALGGSYQGPFDVYAYWEDCKDCKDSLRSRQLIADKGLGKG